MILLMSVMATNRKNTSTLVEKIEEELGRYGRTSAEFAATDDDQTQQFIVPYGKQGWYKIELWHNNASESRYLSAIVELADNQHLNFKVTSGATEVYASSKGVSKLLLKADETYSPQDISSVTLNHGDTGLSGDGVIKNDEGETIILSKNILNIPASSDISTKAKIQFLGTEDPPSSELDDNKSYSYYMKDVDNNFLGLDGNAPTGTKYDDSKSLKWLIEKNEDGSAYKIINTSNNKALSDDGTGTLKVVDYVLNDESQKWDLSSSDSGFFIKSSNTGKLLNIYDNSVGTDMSSGDTITLIKADY